MTRGSSSSAAYAMQTARSRFFAAVLVAACLLAACAPQAPAPPPNVLLVVLDTVRRDRLSTYGHVRETSPHLTQLAKEGARYDDVKGPAAWTIPSHATLMTGEPPAVHGAHHEHFAIRDAATPLAERFSAAGWRTGGFSANPFVGRPSRLDRGFDAFQRIDDGGGAVVSAALEFTQRGDEPWFVFVNLMEAHMPYAGLPESLRQRFMPGTPEETKWAALDAQRRAHLFACGAETPDRELISQVRDLYDAALVQVDEILGELLAGIAPVADRTVVIVLSDHGELLGDHGRVEHQWALFEPLLQLPLVVRAPGQIEPGRIDASPMGLADVHDLVLELAGLEAPARAPAGRAGDRIAEYRRPARLLAGIEKSDPECAALLDRSLVTVERGRWKLEWRSDGAPRLFDLEADPREALDVAGAHPEVVAELVAAAEERRRLAGLTVDDDAAPELSREERARLRALGYLPGSPADGETAGPDDDAR